MKKNSMNIIEVKNLTVSYGNNQKPVLKNFDLSIANQEHVAIIGSSGCGKSTFAKSIVQILPYGSICNGKIMVKGKDPRLMKMEELQIFRRKNFGFIFQDSINKLNPLMTIGDHLYELLKLNYRNKSNSFIKNIVNETFNKVGIATERLNSFPHEFSGGMRQRVCIALALSLNPPLLIADEPTTSLDSFTSYEIMSQLITLCSRFGSTLILISHDIKLAAKWCQKVAIINDGVVVEHGDIKSILKKPKSNIGKKLIQANISAFKSNEFNRFDREIVLEVNNLRHWYRLNSSIIQPRWNKALNEVSFRLFRNEILGVVGLSGSGKSTLSRVLIGLQKARGGQVDIFSKVISSERKKRLKNSKNIQMIFQDPFSSLNPKMTVREILEDIYKIHYLSNLKQMHKEIKSVLNNLNLPIDNYFLKSYPDQLSGGQLQRISIARVLLIKPKILICDESVNMLDASVKIEIIELLRDIQVKMSLSIIFITHDLGLAKQFCNRLIVMDKGRIVEEGDSSIIFQKPNHITTKTLIKSSLSLD